MLIEVTVSFFASRPLTQATLCSSPIISQALPCHSRWEPLKEVLSEGWVGVLSQTLGRINKPGNIKRPFPLHLWTCALDCVNTHWDSLFWRCVKPSNASRKTADLPQIVCVGVVWNKRNYWKVFHKKWTFCAVANFEPFICTCLVGGKRKRI